MTVRKSGMLCPACDIPLYVLDSRADRKDHVRRRRTCESCGYRVTTFELKVAELEELREKAQQFDAWRTLMGKEANG